MTLTLHLSSHGDFELTNFHLEKSLSQALESLDLVENIRTQLLKFFTDDQELNSENFSQDCQSTLTNFKQNVVKDQLSDIKIVWQGTNKCNLFLDGLDDSASLNLSYSPAEELPSGDEEVFAIKETLVVTENPDTPNDSVLVEETVEVVAEKLADTEGKTEEEPESVVVEETVKVVAEKLADTEGQTEKGEAESVVVEETVKVVTEEGEEGTTVVTESLVEKVTTDQEKVVTETVVEKVVTEQLPDEKEATVVVEKTVTVDEEPIDDASSCNTESNDDEEKDTSAGVEINVAYKSMENEDFNTQEKDQTKKKKGVKGFLSKLFKKK